MASWDRRLAVARCALGALIVLWAGVLIGVSFLAAPAKFGAPGLSLPVAMEVGRREFGTLNHAEIVLAVVTLVLAASVRPERAVWLGLGLAALIVLAQWLWLLPVLDARAELIIQGGIPEPAPWHALYIGVEVVKLLALLATGWLTLWRPRRLSRTRRRSPGSRSKSRCRPPGSPASRVDDGVDLALVGRVLLIVDRHDVDYLAVGTEGEVGRRG
jgi:hypothetical protein